MKYATVLRMDQTLQMGVNASLRDISFANFALLATLFNQELGNRHPLRFTTFANSNICKKQTNYFLFIHPNTHTHSHTYFKKGEIPNKNSRNITQKMQTSISDRLKSLAHCQSPLYLISARRVGGRRQASY